MKKFYVIVLLMWLTVSILLHQIDGVNLLVWYALATPMVLIRAIRAVVLIKK